MKTATTVKSTATLGALVKDYVIYNAWVTKTLIDWLKNKPSETLEQVVPSSFPSIKETLIHIWDTQRFWLSVIEQSTPPQSFRFGFEGTIQDVFEGFEEQSDEFVTFVTSLSEADLQEEVSFDTPWVKGTQSRFEFIHHCINHSSYHRGQLVTIGRNVGITDAPMTDYSFYLLMVKGK